MRIQFRGETQKETGKSSAFLRGKNVLILGQILAQRSCSFAWPGLVLRSHSGQDSGFFCVYLTLFSNWILLDCVCRREKIQFQVAFEFAPGSCNDNLHEHFFLRLYLNLFFLLTHNFVIIFAFPSTLAREKGQLKWIRIGGWLSLIAVCHESTN